MMIRMRDQENSANAADREESDAAVDDAIVEERAAPDPVLDAASSLPEAEERRERALVLPAHLLEAASTATAQRTVSIDRVSTLTLTPPGTSLDSNHHSRHLPPPPLSPQGDGSNRQHQQNRHQQQQQQQQQQQPGASPSQQPLSPILSFGSSGGSGSSGGGGGSSGGGNLHMLGQQYGLPELIGTLTVEKSRDLQRRIAELQTDLARAEDEVRRMTQLGAQCKVTPTAVSTQPLNMMHPNTTLASSLAQQAGRRLPKRRPCPRRSSRRRSASGARWWRWG